MVPFRLIVSNAVVHMYNMAASAKQVALKVCEK